MRGQGTESRPCQGNGATLMQAGSRQLPLVEGIRAVAFDCYGTLVDFTDKAFQRAYHEICCLQGLPFEGKVLFDKWMDIWRRMAAQGKARENPRNWSMRNRSLSGPVLAFRPYCEEWPEHFDACFRELGVAGDPVSAYEHVRNCLADASPYEDTVQVLEVVRSRYHTGILSNADNDFLFACLQKNRLDGFELIVTSESAGVYKPHERIFHAYVEEAGLAVEDVLYVGDSQFADVIGAKNAGMRVAWVNRDGAPRHKTTPAPDIEIGSLSALIDLLLPTP